MLAIACLAGLSDHVLPYATELTAIAAAISATFAVLLQERLLEPHLNRWDEATAYIGVHALARFLSGTAS
jgi:hypothetical protein